LSIELKTPRGTKFNSKRLGGVCDSGAFVNLGNGESRGELMNKAGLRWSPSVKGPGSRVAGVQLIQQLLRGIEQSRPVIRPAPTLDDENPKPILPPPRDGGPGIQFFSRCYHLIETLPTLPRDPLNPEDVDTDAEDHAFDSLRYALQKRIQGFKKQNMGGF
jgi:hypothetical protein